MLIQADIDVTPDVLDVVELALFDGLALVAEASDVEVHGEYWINKQYSAYAPRFRPVQAVASRYAAMNCVAASALMAFP
ncbi:hypothetical protein FQZ97_1225100 [compost metagenome]